MPFVIAFLIACLCLLLAPPSLGQSSPPAADSETFSQERIRELVRQVAEKDMENDKAQRNYTYIQREEQHNLSGDGRLKSTEIKTYEIMVLFAEPVRKLISKDDQPLSAKEAAKEEEKIQKIIDKRKNENADERRKRIEKDQKEREKAREFVREVSEAYNFRLVGTEDLGGREAFVVDADPREGYEPQRKEAKMLPKLRFRAWIDKHELQWLKLDIQCIDTVSVGLFLVRLHKGSNIQIEQTRVNEEVWLPKHVALKIDARIALLKEVNVAEDITFRDYRKFRTDTKITPVGEVQER